MSDVATFNYQRDTFARSIFTFTIVLRSNRKSYKNDSCAKRFCRLSRIWQYFFEFNYDQSNMFKRYRGNRCPGLPEARENREESPVGFQTAKIVLDSEIQRVFTVKRSRIRTAGGRRARLVEEGSLPLAVSQIGLRGWSGGRSKKRRAVDRN